MRVILKESLKRITTMQMSQQHTSGMEAMEVQ